MNNTNIKISIIIPVYNAERYLRECLDSICNQSYKELEIILVDDDSQDGSSEICKEYMKIDKHIIYLYKENEGPGVARNMGLNIASGTYIMFIDSDDFLYDVHNIENIVKELKKNNVDLLMYNVGTYWDEDKQLIKEGEVIDENILNALPDYEMFTFLLSKGLVYSGVLGKVLSRRMLLDNDILYANGECEDIVWSVKLYKAVKTIAWCNDMVYIYRKRKKGSRSSAPFTHDNLKVVKDICMEVKEEREQYTENMLNYLAYLYTVWLAQAELSKDSRVIKDVKEMKQCTFLLKYRKHPSVKLANIVYHLLGFKLLMWLLGQYMKKIYKL